jgi:hypothetical protein
LTLFKDFGPSNSIHYAGTSFGRRLLVNPEIGESEADRNSRPSTLIALEPCFFLVFQTTTANFNLSPNILDVFCPDLVINALRIEPTLRNTDTISTILTLLNGHFKTTPKYKLEKLAMSLTIMNHQKNEVVFYQGDRADM